MNDRLHLLGRAGSLAADGEQPPLYLNYAIFADSEIFSPTGLRCIAFNGQESVSEPFEYQLELYDDMYVDIGHDAGRGELLPRDALRGARPRYDQLIGRPITVGVAHPGKLTSQELRIRFERAVRGAEVEDLALFNGIITSVSAEPLHVYRITMKPALWKLSLTNGYRVHVGKNVRDTIAELLDSYRIAYSMDAVSGTDNPALARIQDWLQAGETDLDFIRRLMAKVHLYYYFVHAGNGHRLVFANRPAYPQAWPDRQLRYAHTAIDDLGLIQSDVVIQYTYQESMAPSSVRGVFTRQHAAWEEDAVAQFESFESVDRPDRGELPFNQHRVYQYGCSSEEVRHHTDATASSLQASRIQLSGASHCTRLRSGHQFSMTGATTVDPQARIEPAIEGRRFVVTQIRHEAREDASYKNEFQATAAEALVAPFSVQETQQGALLARVVGHGPAPLQDWRYYSKDYFDPDGHALNDGGSTPPQLHAVGVFVRFATDDDSVPRVWVKLAAHMQTAPELGVTVTVARAQDESELPEIQSIVQANGSIVVMPSGWTASTHVGSSYSTNYGDGKSIRFGKSSKADLEHAIKIVSAPYDGGRYGNTSYAQGASYSFSTAESTAASMPDAGELDGPHGGADDLLSASESFGSTYSRHHAKVTSSCSNIGTTYSKSVVGLSENVSDTTTQKNTSSVVTSDSHNTIGSSTSVDMIGSHDSTSVTGTSTSIQAVGKSSSVSATGIQNNASVTGVRNEAAVTLSSNSASATGTRVSADAVGVSMSASMTGVSNGSSLTGVATEESLTAFRMSTSIFNSSNNISVTLSGTDVNVGGETKQMTVAELKTAIQALTGGVDMSLSPGLVRAAISSSDIEMPAIKLVM
jgi:uncharacterized protein involved in type VI secretion and phage assembly